MNYRAEAGETSSGTGVERRSGRGGYQKRGMNELSVAADIRPRHKLVNAFAESVNGVSMQYGIWGRFCIDIPRHPGQNHPKIKNPVQAAACTGSHLLLTCPPPAS